MINRLIITRVMGNLLLIEAGLLVLSLLFDVAYGDNAWPSFLYTTGICLALAFILRFIGRKAENHMNRRDGYVIVSITWVLFSAIGMLPYLFSGYIPRVADAFFEAMSGFSSTGATILDNIEDGTHGLLFWRSITQWLGGLGIVFFTIAVLPIFGLGDVKLFAAEATGPTHDKLHPRISTTAKRIWTVYSVLTLSCCGLLMLGGVDFFNAICHAMTCTATGGFSNFQDSIAHFHSAYVEYVITFFMLISAVNFTLIYYSFLQGHVKRFFEDTELKWFLTIVIVATLICSFCLYSPYYQEPLTVEESFRQAIFQVVSIITTTGYASADYGLWPHITWSVLCVLMFTGSCAGSTSGGFKMVRVVMLAKNALNEFKHILHPNAVLPVRVNDTVINNSLKSTLLAFFFTYMALTMFSTIVFTFMGLSFSESIGVSLSCISNIGPSFGRFGPAFSWSMLPDYAKWMCSFLMLLGRLEIFSVLILFTPHFWRKR